MRIKLSVLLVICLTACAPKYNYLNSRTVEPSFDHILVVFDYLHVVDDVGKLLDYPADKNKQQIRQLKEVIESTLSEKGFQGSVDFALISSGLGLNPETGFEHYIGGKLQEELIYPPFHLESPYYEDFQFQLIESFADAQSIAFVPVSKKNLGYFDDLRMYSLDLLASQDPFYPEVTGDLSVGVLHIRAVVPKVSFMKAMGVSLLSVGLTAGATGGAYVGISTPVGVAHSTGLLFDNNTGEVIWKNQSAGDLSRFGPQAKARFFKDLPDIGR